MNALYTATREWRHDYINNLQIMTSYAEMGNFEGLSEYLKAISASTDIINTRFSVGDDLINAILNAKSARADAVGIKLNVSGSVKSASSSYDLADIASLVGNVLDNAIEACLRIPPESLPKDEQPEITLTLSETENELNIYQKNPTDGKVRMIHGLLTSSKNNPNHGIGSGLIDSIVEKYHGHIDRTIKDNLFEIFIQLRNAS